VSFSYWVLHGSVDWLWEFAGLGGAAFGLLGLAVATAAPGGRPGPGPSGPARAPAAAAGILIAATCAFALMLPWLAERETERAVKSWRKSPGAAFDRLDRAADLNPLSPTPALAAGSIAVTIDDIGVAERKFDEALARDPRDSYALLMRAAIASEQGQRARAQLFVRRARRAAPNHEVISDAERSIGRGRRVDAIRVAARLSAARRVRVAPLLAD
jgi:tetratricopeptide (TPR) repeat protein